MPKSPFQEGDFLVLQFFGNSRQLLQWAPSPWLQHVHAPKITPVRGRDPSLWKNIRVDWPPPLSKITWWKEQVRKNQKKKMNFFLILHNHTHHIIWCEWFIHKRWLRVVMVCKKWNGHLQKLLKKHQQFVMEPRETKNFRARADKRRAKARSPRGGPQQLPTHQQLGGPP